MTPLEFCYWLSGWFELDACCDEGPEDLNDKQVKVIQEHLKLVFNKVTPNVATLNPPRPVWDRGSVLCSTAVPSFC